MRFLLLLINIIAKMHLNPPSCNFLNYFPDCDTHTHTYTHTHYTILYYTIHTYYTICVCAQSCLALCNLRDCSPPGSSVHGILQARIMEWVPIPFSRIFLTQGSNPSLLHCRQILHSLSHHGSPGELREAQLIIAHCDHMLK